MERVRETQTSGDRWERFDMTQVPEFLVKHSENCPSIFKAGLLSFRAAGEQFERSLLPQPTVCACRA